MSTGVFALVCVICGTAMEMAHPGEARCAECGQRYLARVGYLIPVDEPAVPMLVDEPAVTSPEELTIAVGGS